MNIRFVIKYVGHMNRDHVLGHPICALFVIILSEYNLAQNVE